MEQELSSCAACFYEPFMDTIDSQIMYHIVSVNPLTEWTNVDGRDVNFFLCHTCLTEYIGVSMNFMHTVFEVHFRQVYLVRDIKPPIHQSTNF